MLGLVIVGAGPGLAEALARRFGRDGAPIGLIGRSRARLDAIVARLRHADVNAAARVADANDDDALEAAIASLTEDHGPCGALVYNAAAMVESRPLDLTPDRLRADFDVNVVGTVAAVRAVAPGMVARGRGALLFTGGGLALEPFPQWTSLAMGKAALRSFAFSLAKELGPKGVVCSHVAICGIIEPGGLFDPDAIADVYHELAQAPASSAVREVVFRPPGADPDYNAPTRALK